MRTLLPALLCASLLTTASCGVGVLPETKRSAHFMATTKHLDLGGHVYLYADLDGDIKKITDLIAGWFEDLQKENPDPDLAKIDIRKLVTLLGFDEILAVGLSSYKDGEIFRNINGRPWTTDAVNCGFLRLQIRMGKEEMQRRGETIPDEQIAAFIATLRPTRISKGLAIEKTRAELREEAKRKLTYKRAAQLATRYSLYALRHSWATNALQKGLDGLTVAILMGHEDPSTLAKVYQHLSLNPKHLLEQARRVAG